MKKSLLITLVFLLFSMSIELFAQKVHFPSPSEIQSAPDWAKKMYTENPNLIEIEKEWKKYYQSHPFKKSYHTQYFKRWSRKVRRFMNPDGTISFPTQEEMLAEKKTYLQKIQSSQYKMSSPANWTSIGAFEVFNSQGTNKKGNQTNVYSIARSLSDSLIMYCGTEPGEIFKSTDKGENWFCVSLDLNLNGVTAITIDPMNPNKVFAGEGSNVHLSTDGGASWTVAYNQSNLNPNEIFIHPTNPNLVFLCTSKGLIKSTDGGINWSVIYTEETYDLKLNTANSSIVYILKKNNTLNICEFLKSDDMGNTWNVMTTGWYSSSDPARFCGGGRIGVTQADPNRVYAHLIGASKANDYGYIGLYKSEDGGISWVNPNLPDGGPYSSSHPNLTTFDNGVSDTYNQGFYNCAILVNNNDADDVIIGALNMWRSNDGGSTYTAWAGYFGNEIEMHVDNQDFRAYGNEYYATTDGGIYFSNDFFYTDPEVKMKGLRGSEYWGFSHAWNKKINVGGLYHNGNLAHHENYGVGKHLSLGGGEAPTGYINPGIDEKIYTSDVSGKIIPSTLTGGIQSFGVGMSPNESYYAAESSTLVFHPNNYSTCYLGKDNKIWKSTDDAQSFFELYEAPSADYLTQDIVVAFDNPNVMYVNFRPSSGSGLLVKTTDGGNTWNTLTLPSTSSTSRVMTLAIDISDHNVLYVGYTYGNASNKIFKTIDGGANWQNITGTLIGTENIFELLAVPFTNGGVYCFSRNTVYYRDNSMSEWILHNDGLPAYVSCTGAKPYFRENKIEMASYGKGIWEGDFHTNPSQLMANISIDKNNFSYICDMDSFHFASTSIMNSTCTVEWTFPSGTPSTSTSLHPSVYYPSSGTYNAFLRVSDGLGNSDSDTITFTISDFVSPSTVQEGFETGLFANGWTFPKEVNGSTWSINTSVGAYGTSDNCIINDNFNFDAGGSSNDFRFTLNLDSLLSAKLFFDVAYAPYGGIYIDTLEVLVSSDCGLTFESLYKKGGNDLATAPAITTIFTPTATEWRKDSIMLDDYVNEEKVIIAFRNIGYFGNAVYVDNINLTSQEDTTLVSSLNENIFSTHYFEITPNPVSTSQSIQFISSVKENFLFQIFDANGKRVYWNNQANTHSKINLQSFSNGTYFYSMISDDYMKKGKFIVINR